jgi:hypothetical protein
MRPPAVTTSTRTARFVLAMFCAFCAGSGCRGAEEQDVLEPSRTAGNATGGEGAAPAATTPCASEIEPNDERDDATVLAPSLCGAIEPSNESDFLTFELAPTSTSIGITFTGEVELEVRVDGKSVKLGAGAFPPVPFVKGERYYIEIKALERGPRVPWRVDLVEK